MPSAMTITTLRNSPLRMDDPRSKPQRLKLFAILSSIVVLDVLALTLLLIGAQPIYSQIYYPLAQIANTLISGHILMVLQLINLLYIASKEMRRIQIAATNEYGETSNTNELSIVYNQ